MADEAKSPNRPQGLFAFLFDELRSAVQDIRQKVVEEGWFGRVVTPAPVVQVGEGAGKTDRSVAEDTNWQRRPSFEELLAREPNKASEQARGQEQGIGW